MNCSILGVNGNPKKDKSLLTTICGFKLRSSNLSKVIFPGNLELRSWPILTSSRRSRHSLTGLAQSASVHQLETRALPRLLNTARGSRTKRITRRFKKESANNCSTCFILIRTVFINLMGWSLQEKLRNSGKKHMEFSGRIFWQELQSRKLWFLNRNVFAQWATCSR